MSESNLEYVANVLKKADKPFSTTPAIYCLWGCIMLTWSVITELLPAYTTTYWLIAMPIGFILSFWLGRSACQNSGQDDKQAGQQSFNHFFIMMFFVLTAIATKEYLSIFLIVGLTYSLAGIYMDKIMFWIGGIYWLAYLAIYFGFVTSNLVIGIVFALAFFASAYAASKINNRLMATL